MSYAESSEFVKDAVVGIQARCLASDIVAFTGVNPSEAEILARCRMVFEYMLYEAFSLASIPCDDGDIEVEIQTVEGEE